MKNILRYTLIIAGILAYSMFIGCSDDDKKLGSASISITDFTPMEGLPGTEVTINASGFGEKAKVFLMKRKFRNMFLDRATLLL